ncbi:MAG: elongation factor G [Candidatus Dormibacteraceae bacterium]
MPTYGPDRIRNVVILGHSHEGKTTLAEAMLFASGALPRMGSTEAGTAAMDFEPEEHRRKISIGLGVSHLDREGTKVNLLDAPGFFDFVGQVMSGLSAAEAALVVVSPNPQLAVGTELAWQQCNRHLKPRLVVINKMDRENADYFGALEAMRAQLSPRPVPLQIPIGAEAGFKGVVDLLHGRAHLASGDGGYVEGEIPADLAPRVDELRSQLTEAAAEGDDGLLERYLDQGSLSDEEIERGLREGIVAGTVAPVVCCSAARLTGVLNVLDAIVHLVPPPAANPAGQPRAFVFNTTADPFVGRVSYLKVLSGCIRSDQHLQNTTRKADERVGQLFFPKGKEHANATEICAGDIGAVAKLQSTLTRDLLGSGDGETPAVETPRPIYSLAINPKARGDEEKISSGLARLTEEDPTLEVERSEVTHQHLIRGMGDVHLDVTLEKLKRKYGVEASTEPPRIAYRETIAGGARAEGRHVKQSGGHGQYAICTIEIEPNGHGDGFQWEDKIFGGSIPHNFRPSVEKGIRDAMEKGLVAGYPMVDVRVRLVDGKYHTVDSSDMAFQIAGAVAMRKATLEANPVILEPVLEVEVRIPERYLGEIMSDLNGKRGKIEGTEPDASWQVVRAQVPESEMQKFALDLRSHTQGRGTFSMSFSHYEELPAHLAKGLIEGFQKARTDA